MKNILKTYLSVLLAAMMIFPCGINTAAEDKNGIYREIFVSPEGDDSNEGTISAPFATVLRAKEEARKLSAGMTGDIIVNIADGRYKLDEMLDFTTEDSGKNGYDIIYRGEKGKYPVISGGIDITGFKPWSENADIYCLSLSEYNEIDMVRSFFADNRKYRMAQNDCLIKGEADYDDPKTHYTSDGFYVSKKYMTKYKNVEDLELFWSREWVDVICKVDEIIDDPKNPERLIVKMQQSMWQAFKDYPYSGKSPAYDQYFQVINAMELLDRPGEFYYDRTEKMLYVYPFEGTNLENEVGTIPIIERMMYIVGNDIDDTVHNICFEGLSFAHTTWYAPGRYGYKGHQVQNTWVTNDCAKYMPGTIKLEWADNIHFTDNHFYDHGMTAVDFENAVTNSSCIGNAFNDLDGAAFVEGRREHEEWEKNGGNIQPLIDGEDIFADENYQNPMTDEAKKFFALDHTSSTYARQTNGTKVEERPDGLVDLMAANERALISTSYFGKDVGTNRDYKSMRVLVNTLVKEGKSTGAWFGDPYAPQKGEKTWVRADFERKYSIDKIVLKFDTKLIDERFRQGYEIMLSNDRDFEDDSTVTVAVQYDAAGELMEYPVDLDGQKFRYMMIRTLDATEFGLTTFYVYSKDRKPYTIIKRNKGNSFCNNYLRRIAGYIYSSAAISSDYTEDFNASNNEVIDTPYCGFEMSCGWSWQPYGTTRMNIRNNYINNVTRFLHDGASIYTLGFMPYSYIVGNYIEHDITGNGALYPDMGTSFTLWKDNVVEDTGVYAAHFWIKSERYNILSNTYSDTDMIVNNVDISCKVENPKIFLPGTLQPEAYKIKQEAGLEKEYEYLRDLVADGELRLPDEYQCYLSAASMNRVYYIAQSKVTTAKNMLQNGNFGDLPWDYDYKYEDILRDAVTAVVNRKDPNDIVEIVHLRDTIQKAKNTVNHLSLQDMCNYIDCELAKDAPTYTTDQTANYGEYSLQAKKNLEKALLTLKNSNELEAHLQYANILDAEKAFSEYMDSKISTDVRHAYVEDALEVKISKDDKLITAVMPETVDLSSLAVNIVTDKTSEWTNMNKVFNLNKDVKISVYNTVLKKYDYWTLKAIRNDVKTADSIGKEGWITEAKETEKIYSKADGSLHLDRNSRSYMCDIPLVKNEPYEISFKPITPNEIGEFTLIFGAGRAEGFQMQSKYSSDNRYELEVVGNSADLYFVKNGEKIYLTRFEDINIKYNEFNKINITTQKENNSFNVILTVNNKVIGSAANANGAIGGYIGFDIPNISVDLQ